MKMTSSLNVLQKNILVEIESDSGIGSGFLIDELHVITCKHCIGNNSDNINIKHGSKHLTGKLVKQSDLNQNNKVDIAIVKLNTPCVNNDYIGILDTLNVEDKVNFVGFTSKNGKIDIESKLLTYTGIANKKSVEVQEFSEDKIKHGHSGSAIVNLNTGFICGVICMTEDPLYPQGGYGVPISYLTQDNYFKSLNINIFDKKFQKWINVNPVYKTGISIYNKTFDESHFEVVSDTNIFIEELFVEPNYTIFKITETSETIELPKESFLIDAINIIKEQKLLYLEGAFGVGKTFLSKYIQKELINNGFITIYVSCSELEEYSHYSDFKSEFDTLISLKTNTLVIFDGFDELNLLSKDKSELISKTLKYILLLSQNDNIYTIINTRGIPKSDNDDDIYYALGLEYEEIAQIHIKYIHINNFDKKQITDFITNWEYLDQSPKTVFIDRKELKNIKHINNALKNPLLLFWILLVYQEKGIDEVKDVYSIYESFIDRTIRGKFKGVHKGITEIKNNYRLFLQSLAKSIAISHKEKLFKRRSIYEFILEENNEVYETEIPKIHFEKITKKILTDELIEKISSTRLKENLLICYFLERHGRKWRFKDNNIVFFLLSELTYNSLLEFSKKHTQYLDSLDEDFIYNNTKNDYDVLKNKALPINQMSLDYLLIKIRQEKNKTQKREILEAIKYLFKNRLILNISEIWLSEFDEIRLSTDIFLCIVFLQLNQEGYNENDIKFFFKRLNWIISAAKILNPNYHYLLKRFHKDTTISNVEIRRINLSDFNFQNSRLSSIKFIQCKIFQTIYSKSIFNNSTFFLCDLFKPQFNEIKGELIFNNCKIKDLIIKNPLIIKLRFINCTIEKLVITSEYKDNKHLIELDFGYSNIIEFSVKHCKISYFDIINSKFEDFNITNSLIYVSDETTNEYIKNNATLRNNKINYAQQKI